MADETDYQDEPRHEEQEQGGSDNEVCSIIVGRRKIY